MKNRLSLRTFFVYFLCIALPILLLTTNYTVERARQLRNDYASSKSEAMDHIAQTLTAQFNLLESTANEIYRSSWYKKSISLSSTFQQEMNLVRQMEIAGDLLYKTTLLPFVEDILIFNANKKSIICKYGWFSDWAKYTGVYCNVDLSGLPEALYSSNLFDPIRSLEEGYWVLSYPDPNLSSPCRLAFLIDSSKLQLFLDQLKLDHFTSVSIGMEPSGNDYRTLKRPDLTLTFDYPHFDDAFSSEYTRHNALLLVLAFAISVLLALLFTRLFTWPLDKLFHAISYSSSRSQRNALEGLTSHILDITQQNEALQKKMGSFISEMRCEILLRLMAGSQEGELGLSTSVGRLFPWLSKGQPYFLMIARREEPLWASNDSCVELGMPLDYHGYLFWAENQEKGRILYQQTLETDGLLAVSDLHAGTESLTACYQEVMEQLNARKERIPLGDMLPLLIHLQNGEKEGCLQVLARFRQKGLEQEATYVLNLLQQWAEEKGTSVEVPHDEQNHWDTVEKYIVTLCNPHAIKTRRSSAALIASVNHYINESYQLTDLSLKYLADQFDTSIGALSRLYKQETGQNFSTALLAVRMNKAMELLVQTDDSLSAIALRCGYENYLSFKRAFLRFVQMTPREYREAHVPTKASQ